LSLGKKNTMQSGGWSSAKRFFKELDSVENVARIAVQKTVEKLNPKPVATKKVPVIFDRYAAPSFWMGVLLSLDGDSAFRETTFMSDQLEKLIASPLVTLADDPTVPRFVGSMPFDGEGNITRRNVIIDKGILKLFRYDSQTARKAGVKAGTIAGRSGYRSMPSASFLCVTLDNGTESVDSIIQGIKEGLLVTEMRGLGTDATTGSFSVGCGGFWIVDGAVAHPVDGVTLGGSTLELLKSIEKVGNDLDMRGGFNSPSFRVAELTVGGKK
jgi:PmbA protein